MYLVVLGTAAWQPGRNLHFKPGVHEVSDEIGEMARRAGIKRLIVTEEEPTIAQEKPGPLTLEDVKIGVRGVQLARPEDEELEEIEVERDTYRCSFCTAAFPSGPARDRHVEFNHDVG